MKNKIVGITDVSNQECPQCGYLFMDFYEAKEYFRFLCPDCGFEEVRKKNTTGRLKNKRKEN